MAAITLSRPGRLAQDHRRAALWIGMLALAQLADLVTTQVAMAHGGVEGNRVAAGLIAIGGIGLLWLVKAMLVLAMGSAVWLVQRYRQRDGGDRSVLAAELVWRGLQLCVLVLVVTAAHNLTVIQDLSSL